MQLLIILACILISAGVQALMNNTYSKYLRQYSLSGVSGFEIASRFLRENGIYDVKIIPTYGNLTDHYDPLTKTISLSSNIYDGTSIASVAVACHEVGHAIQHHNGYVLLLIRNKMVPVVKIASSLSWILIFLGIILGILELFLFGIIAFGIIALFQLITLPVEINASKRALQFLDNGYLNEDERSGAKQVLAAAALTYVASLFISLLQIARFLLLLLGGRRRR